jgi:gentisate 1,2-dioxygenase
MTAQTTREAALQQLSAAIQPPTLAPVWTRYQAMLTPTPQGKARPCLRRYADLRPHLLRAGELVSTTEAERRVLMLLNPGLEGVAAATPTLFAGRIWAMVSVPAAKSAPRVGLRLTST